LIVLDFEIGPMREQHGQNIDAASTSSSNTRRLTIVVDVVDARTSAQKHFDNVNATQLGTHGEKKWRWIEIARQTSIDVD
jgi:hypothetical protein